MFHGRLGNTSKNPYFQGRVLFPRLKIAIKIPPIGEADVSFLADTGADRTLIMPSDFFRFGITLAQLTRKTSMNGVGGQGDGFLEEALVTFSEPGAGLHVYQMDLVIAAPNQAIMQCPSLLGRDIMNRWCLTVDGPRQTVSAKIASSDNFLKFTGKVKENAPLVGVAPPLYRD